MVSSMMHNILSLLIVVVSWSQSAQASAPPNKPLPAELLASILRELADYANSKNTVKKFDIKSRLRERKNKVSKKYLELRHNRALWIDAATRHQHVRINP